MVDPDLIAEIRARLTEFQDVQELPEHAARLVIDGVAKDHIIDRDRTWWWTSLKDPSEVITYGESDGLLLLASTVPGHNVGVLVVTDDEPPPWPAFQGPVQSLLAVLRGLRFCEYFIADPDGRWVVFDTHDNSLVVRGDLARLSSHG